MMAVAGTLTLLGVMSDNGECRVGAGAGDTVRGDTLAFLESLGRPYLHKPFSLAQLRAALATAVGATR